MYHYAMIEYKDGSKRCASLYGSSYSDCIEIVSIAVNGDNEQIKNAWVESSAVELMDEE